MFNGDTAWLKRAIPLTFLVLSFFSLMSRIDYIVNGTLYGYGLHFSYDWARGYWATYYTIFVVFGLVVSCAHWFGSQKTRGAIRFSVALFITIVLLATGGLQDIMFFVFWAGGLPPNNVVWWWAPWIGLTGTWNSVMQVALFSFICFMTVPLWLCMFRKSRIEIN